MPRTVRAASSRTWGPSTIKGVLRAGPQFGLSGAGRPLETVSALGAAAANAAVPRRLLLDRPISGLRGSRGTLTGATSRTSSSAALTALAC